jgi:hypothetical protein
MIFERYYSYIKNYQSEDGQKFLERVYNPIMENVEKTTPPSKRGNQYDH